MERSFAREMLSMLEDEKERRKEETGGRRRGFIYPVMLSKKLSTAV